MNDQIDMPALGAEGDRCTVCRAPLAIDQRYCLQCGQRRGDRRVDFAELLPLEEGGKPAEAAPATAVAPAAPPPQSGPWTPLALVASVATLGLMLLVGVMIGKDDDPTQVTAAPAAAPAIASTDAAGTGTDAADTGGGADANKDGGGDTRKTSDDGGKGGDEKTVPASQAPGAQQLDEGDLDALDDATGEDAANASADLPDTIATPGEPPPTDNQAPGGGSDAQVIK